jgi:hypothetical protein
MIAGSVVPYPVEIDLRFLSFRYIIASSARRKHIKVSKTLRFVDEE